MQYGFNDLPGSATDTDAETDTDSVCRGLARCLPLEGLLPSGSSFVGEADSKAETQPAGSTQTPAGQNSVEQKGHESTPEAAAGAVGVVTAHHLLGANDMDTLRQRLGEARRVITVPGENTPWVRVRGSRWKAASKAIASGFKLDEGVVEVGLDHQFDDTLVGGFLDYVHADSKMDGDTKVRSRGGRVGFYLTHNLDCGAWIDVVGRLGFDRNRLRYKKAGGAMAEVNGIEGVYGNLSVETGRSFEIVDSLRVEPQFQAVFTRSGKVTLTDADGHRIEAKAHSDVTTRLGALVEKSLTDPTGSDIRAYGKLSWERNWSRGPVIHYWSGKFVRPDWKGNRFIYGLGIEGTTENKHTWHASVEQSRGGAFRNDIRVDLGMRLRF